MNQPKIEYKNRRAKVDHKTQRARASARQDTTISLLEAKLRKDENTAREMLTTLELALVSCGYVRDGIYNSRQARHTGAQERAVILHWREGKILMGRGLAKDDRGKLIRPLRANLPASVRGMKVHDLTLVARHLAFFVDALEDNVRHQITELRNATELLQGFIQRIEADPKPSENPAQMSEDPEVGIPEDPSE